MTIDNHNDYNMGVSAYRSLSWQLHMVCPTSAPPGLLHFDQFFGGEIYLTLI